LSSAEIDLSKIAIEPLGAQHERLRFNSGNASLDQYIRQQAGQDTRRDLARVWVAVGDENPARILGYFTLSATSVSREDFPNDLGKRLPKYPIPAALVGRLAVDREYAGIGLGRALLGSAIGMLLGVSRTMAFTVVVVDPIDERAAAFYRRFGFQAFGSAHGRMFLSVASQHPQVPDDRR
jgi:GNAT superfamily N-acetyltransferase